VICKTVSTFNGTYGKEKKYFFKRAKTSSFTGRSGGGKLTEGVKRNEKEQKN